MEWEQYTEPTESAELLNLFGGGRYGIRIILVYLPEYKCKDLVF